MLNCYRFTRTIVHLNTLGSVLVNHHRIERRPLEQQQNFYCNTSYDTDYEYKSTFKTKSVLDRDKKKTSVLTGQERTTKSDTANLSLLNRLGLLQKGLSGFSNETGDNQDDGNLTNLMKKKRKKKNVQLQSTLNDDQVKDNSNITLNTNDNNDTIEYHPSLSSKSKSKSIDKEDDNNSIVDKPKRKRKTKKEKELELQLLESSSSSNKSGGITVENEEVVLHPSMTGDNNHSSKVKRKSRKSNKINEQSEQDQHNVEYQTNIDGVIPHDVNWLINNQMTMIDSPIDYTSSDIIIDQKQQQQQVKKISTTTTTTKAPKRVVHKPMDENAIRRFKEWINYRQQLLESIPTQVDLPDLEDAPLTVTPENAKQSPLNQAFPWDRFVEGCNRLVFGNERLRPLQSDAINSVLYRRDTFVSLPTGGGKSLCFQLPAIIDSGVTLVISPLLALMFDQLSKLLQLGVPTCALNSSVPVSEKKKIIKELLDPAGCPYKLLYVTPERMKTQEFIDILEHLNNTSQLKRLVIDEAHCISEWGHDFRKDYRKLSKFREMFPNIPIVALTATATPKVELDIKQQLSMHNTINIRGSFIRSNLKYEVRKKSTEPEFCFNDIYHFVNRNHKNSSGIVYCSTIAECESLCEYLTDRGLSVDFYHASLNAAQRVDTQERWITGKFKIVCTTIAFGMGIDKPDTRFVIHHSIPSSIESYYQQTGRAGRDGKLSDCILYYNKNDIRKMLKISTMGIVAQSHEEYQKIMESKTENIDTVTSYCVGSECRRVSLMEYFGEETKPCKTMCDNCTYTKANHYFEDDDNIREHERVYTSRFNYGATKKSKSKSRRYISMDDEEDEVD
ncbi:ATP-dependent DNA helicase RecQ family protein [Heterostelium album PN500]|uniref:ATP-dependent DNA helicase n=1 Tax=Heterostelium pallidum (strain ATCC 26659 / Pp 5 / PN500) TaxID=670386 RepID=D3BEY5_HETP5|nr:ATP-dependent DNA helicase RecQ family protein [Heterostelium album PN500]EFA80466.1 ATP-dependent DNA helicase RecQ family protein [Heterostelium album PN500]|eukprot:XP_020432586.1 ATP-dependent DNA helicase RecQ family protein [Heterostelium album PN500]